MTRDTQVTARFAIREGSGGNGDDGQASTDVLKDGRDSKGGTREVGHTRTSAGRQKTC